MAQQLLRVEQQRSAKTAHSLDNAAVDAPGGSATLITRLEALESTCQALQLLHNKTGANMLGNSLGAANTQLGFSQLGSCMEVLHEFLQFVAEERAERTKALREVKQRMDERFEAVDCRLAFARLISELKAELRAEMANHTRTFTLELRGELRDEILREVAVLEEKAEARMKLLETQLTGDPKKNGKDLGMRIDFQAIERGIRGALPEDDARDGGKRSCSPKLAMMPSGSSNSIIHTQHTSLAPVDSSAADLQPSERSNSCTDVDARGSLKLVWPEHSNFPCRQPPLVRTGETSLGDEDLKNIQDGVSPLSDGFKQSLVSVHHRTSPKKDGSVRSAVGPQTSSVPVRIPEENKDEPPVKVVSQCERRPTDGSSKWHSLSQKFRTTQELPAVTNQLDSEPSTSEPAVRLGSSTQIAATSRIVSRRPNIGSAEMASTLSQKLVQHPSSG